MSKKHKKLDQGMVQLTLPMSSLPTRKYQAGALRAKEAVREALVTALSRSGLDREYVAEELSRLIGEPVSVHTLNSWTADSKGSRRLPLEYAGALCVILGDMSLLRAAITACGFAMLDADEVAVFELGQLTIEKKRRAKKEREIMERLNG